MPAKRRALFSCLLPLFLLVPSQAQGRKPSVLARWETLEIPTYPLGPDDPFPPLYKSRVYPYPMQTSLSEKKEVRSWKAAVLENEWIRLEVVPDLGGRIYGALARKEGNFDFLYRNGVVKPALVGLRGAWLSGGVEWNFPSLGHTVTTVSPVFASLRRNPDGSATIFTGDTEWVRRMRWRVGITLYPDRSYIRVDTVLYNRTLLTRNGYYWANAAAHASRDAKVIFPPTDYVVTHGRRRVYSWPVDHGMDLSLYREIPFPGDFFCARPGDYNGVYYLESDRGTVHAGNRWDCPGKKFWTWGTAPLGRSWERYLTDGSGPYIEIQSGRLPNQADTWLFEPRGVESWTEYWYPVGGMGGLTAASRDAALFAGRKGKKLSLGLNVTRPFRDLSVLVEEEGAPAAVLRVGALAPGEAFRKEVKLLGDGKNYRVRVTDRTGRILLSWSPKKDRYRRPSPWKEPKPYSRMTAEELALEGLRLEKDWKPSAALALYERALAEDPAQMDALVFLVRARMKRGETEKALWLCRRALREDRNRMEARYLFGLGGFRIGGLVIAEEALRPLTRRLGWKRAAWFLIGLIQGRRGKWAEGAESLARAAAGNPGDSLARALRAAFLRRLGRKEEARREIASLLRDDPLCAPARREAELLGMKGEDASLRDLIPLSGKTFYRGAEDYLELAWDYWKAGLREEALGVLQSYLDRAGGKRLYPMALYTMFWFLEELGEEKAARDLLEKAESLPADYVFPHRVESIAVLRDAIRRSPSSWKARYYLGTLYYGKGRKEEGAALWREAASKDPDCPVLMRNLALYEWKEEKNLWGARTWIRKVMKKHPGGKGVDPGFWAEAASIDPSFAEKAPKAARSDQRVQLTRAVYWIEQEDFDKAIEVLEAHTFHPWEGWTGARDAWVLARLLRGVKRLDQGFAGRALKDFRAALAYPENLGTGRPWRPMEQRTRFFEGLALEALGRVEEARAAFGKAADREAPPLSPFTVYRALAMAHLGREKEARSLLAKLLFQARERWKEPERRSASLARVRALAFRALGLFPEARRAFEEARRLDPKSPWIGREKDLFLSPFPLWLAPPGEARLVVVPSKPVYQEGEPVIFGFYLQAPPGKKLVLPTGPYLAWDTGMESRSLWRTEALGALGISRAGSEGADCWKKMRRVEKTAPGWKWGASNDVIGIGVAGKTLKRSDFLVVPPGGKVFLGAVKEPRWRKEVLGPGEYTARAVFRARRPEPKARWFREGGAEPGALDLLAKCRPLEVRARVSFKVIPPPDSVLEKWKVFRGLELGLPPAKVEALLGKPVSRKILSPEKTWHWEKDGEPRAVWRLVFSFGPPCTPPSPYEWGKVGPLKVEVHVDKAANRIIDYSGEFFYSP